MSMCSKVIAIVLATFAASAARASELPTPRFVPKPKFVNPVKVSAPKLLTAAEQKLQNEGWTWDAKGQYWWKVGTPVELQSTFQGSFSGGNCPGGNCPNRR